MLTPLLDRLKTQGGTLYTFSSAAKDLNRTFSSSMYDFTFSHFACLNIPNIRNCVFDADSSNENLNKEGLYLGTLLTKDDFEEEPEHSGEITMFSSDGMNIALTENIQNYIMNFETAILNGSGDNDDYDESVLKSVSERVFFNWLQKVGAIKFTGENNNTNVDSVVINNANIVENGTSVVKYIGTIDAMNNVDILGDSYSEVYLYVPGDAGSTNNGNIHFYSPAYGNGNNGDAEDTKNYIANKTYSNVGSENIIGRESISTSPYGMSIKAIYDDDSNNAYTSDYGFCINFNPDNYGDYTDLVKLNSDSTTDFEFNCVLIYYTLKDNSTGKSAINLYGVLFLEEISDIKTDNEQDSSTIVSYEQGYIQRYPKIKGNGSGNGNSFALKVDLKIDTLPDLTTTAKIYNDPNSAISMSLYMEALSQLQNCVSVFNQQQQEIQNLQSRIEYLENQLSLLNEIPTIEDKLSTISDAIVHSEQVVGLINWDEIDDDNLEEVVDRLKYAIDFGGVVVDGVNIKDLILENSKNIDSIIAGKLTQKLQYNTDAIGEGYGINITNDTTNQKLEINNKVSSYSITSLYSDYEQTSQITKDNILILTQSSSSIKNYVYATLKECSNLGILYINGTCNCDLNIYIDDTIGWKTGQSFKIKINGNLISSTDSDNTGTYVSPRLRLFSGDSEITSITDPEYVKSHEGAKYIEIICVDSSAVEYDDKFIYEIS